MRKGITGNKYLRDYEVQQLLDVILPKTLDIQNVFESYWGQEIRAILPDHPTTRLTTYQMSHLKRENLVEVIEADKHGQKYAFTEKALPLLKQENAVTINQQMRPQD